MGLAARMVTEQDRGPVMECIPVRVTLDLYAHLEALAAREKSSVEEVILTLLVTQYWETFSDDALV